MSDFKNMQV